MGKRGWCLAGAIALVGAPGDGAAQFEAFLGGHEVETLGWEVPGTGRIGGVTVDGYQYLYVANQDEGVWKLHPDGRAELFLDGLYGSASGTTLPGGVLIHTEFGGDRVFRVDRDGSRTVLVEDGLQGPVGIVRVGDTLYTPNAKSDWVAKITMDGQVSELVRDDRLQVPNGIAADADGNLYVVSIRNTLVLKVTPDGSVSEVAELPGQGNAHVAFADGALYVTQIWDHVILRVELDGRWSVVAGDGTPGSADGGPEASKVTFPNGITVSPSGGALYFNTLDGAMIAGHPGVIRVHKLHLPTPQRAFTRALDAGGLEGLRRTFEQALELEGVPHAQLIPGIYQIGGALISAGRTEAGLALTTWAAEVDPDPARAALVLGQAHARYGEREVAISHLERVLQLDPENARAADALATVRAYRRNRP